MQKREKRIQLIQKVRTPGAQGSTRAEWSLIGGEMVLPREMEDSVQRKPITGPPVNQRRVYGLRPDSQECLAHAKYLFACSRTACRIRRGEKRESCDSHREEVFSCSKRGGKTTRSEEGRKK